jgi:hypothetical protein
MAVVLLKWLFMLQRLAVAIEQLVDGAAANVSA